MHEFITIFTTHILRDAKKVFEKYPAFWHVNTTRDALWDRSMPIVGGPNAYDVVAMIGYYNSLAASKDTIKVFSCAVRHVCTEHGYGPDQTKYLAVWWFLIHLLAEYDQKVGLQPNTDIKGMFECYINTGEIDYEHSW